MERRKDLDFAKGIGIILMVLGHCYSEGNGAGIRTWLHSFHMPLFFIIPGILARSRTPSFSGLLKKRTRSLLVPYFLWGVMAAVYLTVMGRKPLEWLLALLKSVLTFQGLSALWFLPCLFLAELLFHGLLRAAGENVPLRCGLVGILAVLGAAPAETALAAVLLRSFTGAAFLYLGWLLADLSSRPCKTGTWAALFVAQVFLAMRNGQISVVDREYGNIVLFYLNALLGSWLMIRLYHVLVSLRWERIARTAVWFGENSLIVVCTSLYVIDMLRLADHKLFGSILPTLGSLEGLILCALAMGLEAVAIVLCGKYLWFTLGKKNPKKLQATEPVRPI